MSTNVIHIENVYFSFDRKGSKIDVLHNAKGEVRSGELVGLIGPNGRGKTTLLRILSGFLSADQGEVSVMGKPIDRWEPKERSKQLSVILTGLPESGLDVYSVIAMGRHPYTGLMGKLTVDDQAAVDRAIERAGVGDLKGRLIGELSDGQRQKVMIARCLAQDTPLILMDEPTAFLDLNNKATLIRMLKDLTSTDGKTILLSTHEVEWALDVCDRLWVMTGEGIEQGSPGELVGSGVIASTFEKDGLKFDEATGRFRHG